MFINSDDIFRKEYVIFINEFDKLIVEYIKTINIDYVFINEYAIFTDKSSKFMNKYDEFINKFLNSIVGNLKNSFYFYPTN